MTTAEAVDVDAVGALFMDVQAQADAAMTLAALRAVMRVQLVDVIPEGGGPLGDVASAAGVDAGALRRVARFLAGRGWLELEGDRLAVEPTRRAVLARSSPMWASLTHVGAFEAMPSLDVSLRTGESTFDAMFGSPFFEWLSERPEAEAIFAEAMQHEGAAHVAAVPFMKIAPGAVVADIGAGTGGLLSAVLDANADATGILVDRASVLAGALESLTTGVLASRCRVQPGDLFGVMPEADVYILARVLHDWADDDASVILRRIRDAATPGARLHVLDLVVPEGSAPQPSHMSDLGMLLLFGGGRERTEREVSELLAGAGWRLDEVTDLGVTSLLAATAVS